MDQAFQRDPGFQPYYFKGGYEAFLLRLNRALCKPNYIAVPFEIPEVNIGKL